MAISFASARGNLMNRWGKLGLMVKQVYSYMQSQQANMIDAANGVTSQLNSEPDIQAIMGGGYLGVLSAADTNIGGTVQTLAAAIANRTVYRDNPRLNQTLTNSNTLLSVLEIIRQMKQQAQTVLAQSVTATPGTFGSTNSTGNGAVVLSVRRPLDGVVLENAFAENLQVLCTSDSYLGGAVPFNEGFQITGAGAQNDLFAFNWPLGSNCSRGLSAVDAYTNNGAGNLLTNGGFGAFTGNVPNNFTLVAGAAGTNVAQEGSLTFGGTGALKVIGDGSTLTQLTQQFGVTGGTAATLSPLTQYSFCVWARRDGTAANQGQWVIDLIDGNGNVIKDAAGSPNAFTIDLTALTTTYAPYSAAFRTPEILPATYSWRMRHPTGQALQSGRAVYFGKAGLGVMTQLYTHGPYASVHSGSVPFTQGDYTTCPVTNSRGAGGTLSTWQTLMYQLLPDVVRNEILFPSSATPTISDNLIG